MTDEKSGTRSSVGLLDIASNVPGLLLDAPTILRGVITGFGARPSAKTSIGKVFQERAAHHADKVFIKFGDEKITYREANETVNRYAAVLAGISLDASQATVIASCQFVVGPLRLYVPSSRIEVVYNGVESSQAHPANGALPSEWLVGVVGRIAPEKGQLEFLQAARLLPPNCRFVICGSPLFANPTANAYFDHLRESANGLPVEFLGWRDDVGAVLSHLHLLVVPSTPGEGTTRVILEAYAAGVPVVAMNSGGIPEIVSDGETGLLAPAGDPAKLAAKIREGLERPASLARMAQNARLAWRDRYTLKRYQTRILSILERVGASARA